MAQDLSSLTMIEMAIFDSSTMLGTFQSLNGASSYTIFTGSGFQYDIKILQIFNGGTQGFIGSLDGVTNNFFIPSFGSLILDVQSNHSDNSAYGSGTLNGRTGQQIFGKGTAGVGNIYIMGWR